MKLVFFGTSPRSALFLEKAIQNGLKFDLVISQPPKPIGRKNTHTQDHAIAVSKVHGIPYLENLEEILNYPSPTLGLILDFNKIIPEKIINHFKKGIINIHFSKLPQYRGPAPVQYTILNGDKQAWATYLLISPKLDQGKIISQTSIDLDFTETTDFLYQKLIDKSASEVSGILKNYLAGKIIPQPQTGTSSLTKKLTSENCKINWSESPEKIERLIRAAYSEPGAWTEVTIPDRQKIRRLKILKAHLEGTSILVRKGLVLDIVQLESKKPISWKQFLEGYPEARLI